MKDEQDDHPPGNPSADSAGPAATAPLRFPRNRQQGETRPSARDAVQRAKPVKNVPVAGEHPLYPVKNRAQQGGPAALNMGVPSYPPLKRRRGGNAAWISFVIMVVIPTCLTALYYYIYATPQYASEFRFSVQDASAPTSPQPSNVLQSLGLSSGADNTNNYLVIDFLKSREAVEQLEQKIHLKDRYSSLDVDWFSRFDAQRPLDAFVSYWRGMISANYDQVTGLATVNVRAFSPQDAVLIAQTLEKASEDLINGIASRSQVNAVRFAENEAQRAQERLKDVRQKLTEYRNRVGVLDPTASVTASNSALVQSLQSSLAQLETQLATLKSQNLQAKAPAIVSLSNQIQSTKDQLRKIETSVAGKSDTLAQSSLSHLLSEYEQLNLEVQFAQAQVTGTLQALDAARANAAAQHLYITPYVRPRAPTSSSYPKRTMEVVETFLYAFAAWFIALLIMRSIRERFA